MLSIAVKNQIKKWIVSKSEELGFSQCRMTPARELTDEARNLEKWLRNGNHGHMAYMENHFEKRIDPTKLFPGTKTVVVFSHNYFPKEEPDHSTLKIARYAYGRDYHKVLKKKLKILVDELQEKYGQIEYRTFVDSAPILERDWAKHAGIGWVGKNTLALTKSEGSYYFLSILLLPIDLPSDSPVSDYCGSCTKCIDACPTEAIDPSGPFLHAEKCISYLTIELKDKIPHEFQTQMDGWIFGCDICQEVCPWNRFAQPNDEEKFSPNDKLLEMTDDDWLDLSRETFDVIFSGTPVKRAGYDKLKQTIQFVREN